MHDWESHTKMHPETGMACVTALPHLSAAHAARLGCPSSLLRCQEVRHVRWQRIPPCMCLWGRQPAVQVFTRRSPCLTLSGRQPAQRYPAIGIRIAVFHSKL